MEITLRKANALQHEIRSALGACSLAATVRLNEFENPEERIAAARADWQDLRARGDALRKALYEIRRAVGARNATCGVDERLSEMAEIDETIAALRVAAESPARPSEEVVTGMVGKLSEPRERRPLMRSEDTVEVGIFHETEQAGLQGELKKLRRRKREIQDELLQINIENRIALSESAEATLLAEGII